MGDGNLRIGPRLAAAGAIGAFAYGANIGTVFRNPDVSTFANSPIDHDLVFALSAGALLANGKVVVIADTLTDASRRLRKIEPDSSRRFIVDVAADYDRVYEV